MYHFLKKAKDDTEGELLLRSPREEFERFVGRRLRALEALDDPAEADRVLAALQIGRERLSAAPGGQQPVEPPTRKVPVP